MYFSVFWLISLHSLCIYICSSYRPHLTLRIHENIICFGDKRDTHGCASGDRRSHRSRSAHDSGVIRTITKHQYFVYIPYVRTRSSERSIKTGPSGPYSTIPSHPLFSPPLNEPSTLRPLRRPASRMSIVEYGWRIGASTRLAGRARCTMSAER